MQNVKRTALVTGGNRGIGKEVCRQLCELNYQVILTCRNIEKGILAVKEIRQQFENIDYYCLDVCMPETFKDTITTIINKYGRIDLLVNNAGISVDKNGPEYFLNQDPELMKQTLDVNLLGPVMLIREVLPYMVKQKYGRIVNVSSGYGRFEELDKDSMYYRISKTALNAATKIIAKMYGDMNILVNAVCPGWTSTDMGGADAPRSVQKGAQGIVWAATLPDHGPSGLLFRDGKVLSW